MKVKTLLVIIVLVLLLSIGLPAESRKGPPATPTDPNILAAFDALESYIATLPSNVLTRGQRNSLTQKLANAERAYNRGQACTAANIIGAYLNETQALRHGKRLDIAEDLYNRGRTLQHDLLASLPDGETCPGHPLVGKKPEVGIGESDNQHLEAIVSFGEARTLTVEADGELFTRVDIPGTPVPIGAPGFPAVPVLRFLIAVPRGAGVSVMATPYVGETIQLNLYPIQPQPLDQFEDQPFEKNDAAYATDRLYPEELCAVIPLGYMRDVQIAEIACATGQYNPVTDRLTLFESVDFEVNFIGGTGAFVTEATLNPFDHTLSMVEGNVINSDSLTGYIEPVPQPINLGEELLILTHPDFWEAALRLAEWKREKGIMTNIFEVNDGLEGPGPDTNEQIDDFIEDRYHTSGVRPSYVLLLGDAEFIPTFYVDASAMCSFGPCVGSDTIGSDYPYAVVTTPGAIYDYLLPDLGVGRISVDTLGQANAVVDKIIQYESTPPTSDSFYENATVVSQFQCCRDVAQNGTAQRTFVECSEFARNLLVNKGYSVERIYTETVDSFYTYDRATMFTSPDGITWDLRSDTDSSLNRVTYGNDIFVAVGGNGAILTSPDGAAWTPRESGTNAWLYGVAYGNNTFVAVGGYTILTSPDGAVWATQTQAPHILEDVTYGNNAFVAVGGDGTIVTSPDGETWTPRTSGTTEWLYGVAYGDNAFVAVGRDGTILTSSDGAEWTPQTSGTTEWLSGVAYGNHTFVAVGWDGTIVTSPDGETWTARASGTTEWLYRVTYGDNIFLVPGGYDTLLTSPDGSTWTKRTLGIHNSLRDFAYGDNIFVGIGGRDTTARHYFDGTPLPAEIGPENGFSWDGSTQDIIDAFNAGQFLIMHRDHGGPDQWVHPYLSAEDVFESLYNEDLLPVVFSINCASGLFDNETEDGTFGTAPGFVYFAEALLRNSDGGAVGVLGATRYSPSWPNTYLAQGLFDAIWPDAIPDFGDDTSKRRLADILNHGKLYLLSQVGAYANILAEFHMSDPYGAAINDTLDEYALWHAFGDPTLEIWTSNPTTHWLPFYEPEIIFFGEDFMRVRYPKEGATLTAFQGTLPIARSVTNEEGVATLYYVNKPQSGMPIMFSASKENYVSVLLTPLLQIDQVNDVPTDTSGGCGATTEGSLFQSFTPSTSNLAAVDLRLRAGGSFPSEGIATGINIRSGTVDGSVLGTATAFVSGPQATGPQPVVRFQFSPPVSLVPGETYVIEWITPGDVILTWVVAEGDPYPGGTAFGCSGQAIENEDFIFTTYAHTWHY